MPPHPQARRWLDEVAAAPTWARVGHPDLDLPRLRAQLRALVPPAPPGSLASERVTVGGIPCLLQRPRPGAPLFVLLHGGGWALGSAAEMQPWGRAIAQATGAAVLSVDYRLAPEHPFPAGLEDVETVLAALPQAADELAVDAGRLVVGGDSAGGNLAAAAAQCRRDRRAPPWAATVLLYPALDLAGRHPSRAEFSDGFGMQDEAMAWHEAAYVPVAADRERPDVSPLLAGDLRGLPPTLVVTAGYDPLRDEGEAYAARLADAGVPTACTRYVDMVHGFADLTRFDAAHALVGQVAGWLGRTVPGVPAAG